MQEYKETVHKYPDSSEVTQQVNKVLSDSARIASRTPGTVLEIEALFSVKNRAKDGRMSLCKVLNGNSVSSVLYQMYMVTVSELKPCYKTVRRGWRKQHGRLT
jgi:hypothetical protein